MQVPVSFFYKCDLHKSYLKLIVKYLGPVVQSIVSLTTSLRGHFVKYKPNKLSNTLLFFVGKCENLLHCKRFSHFFNKNNSVFVILTF